MKTTTACVSKGEAMAGCLLECVCVVCVVGSAALGSHMPGWQQLGRLGFGGRLNVSWKDPPYTHVYLSIFPTTEPPACSVWEENRMRP